MTLWSVAPSLSASDNLLAISSQPDLINWVVGPAKADLGYSAQIDVPAGFRFASASDAAIVLRAKGNPTPQTLAGLIAPIGGNYVVVFEYTPVGYVKSSRTETIDADAVLNGVRQNLVKQGGNAGAITSVEWQVPPKFDTTRNALEWALVAQSGSRKTVNHVIRLLGREGVLDGIAVQDSSAMGQVPLGQLMAGVSFKSGYTYADYRKGDRIAANGLADLIAADSSGTTKAEFPYVWAISGGAAVIVLVGGFVVVRRKSRRDHAAHLSSAGTANGASKAMFNRMVALQTNGHSNGNGKLNGNGHGKIHRRRVFNYQKFYSDLMFQVSDQGLQPSVVSVPRFRAADKRSEVKSEAQTVPSGMPAADPYSPAVNASLIESQKRLIEEQQRLIREQSKLIEEKSKLIQEKNQVLDKQAELFGNNVF